MGVSAHVIAARPCALFIHACACLQVVSADVQMSGPFRAAHGGVALRFPFTHRAHKKSRGFPRLFPKFLLAESDLHRLLHFGQVILLDLLDTFADGQAHHLDHVRAFLLQGIADGDIGVQHVGLAD